MEFSGSPMASQSTLISDASVFYIVLFIGVFFVITVITVVSLLYLGYRFLSEREKDIRSEIRQEIATLTSRASDKDVENRNLAVKVAELGEIVASLRSTIEQLKADANVMNILHAGEKHSLITQVADLKSSLMRVEEDLRDEKFKSMELQNSLNELRRSVSTKGNKVDDLAMIIGMIEKVPRGKRSGGASVEEVTDTEESVTPNEKANG